MPAYTLDYTTAHGAYDSRSKLRRTIALSKLHNMLLNDIVNVEFLELKPIWHNDSHQPVIKIHAIQNSFFAYIN